MPDRHETITTADGTMDVFITYPDGDGPFPVLVQIMDGIGMREEIHDHARRAASWGYYVVSPDMFYRDGIKGPQDFSIPESRDMLMAAIGKLTAERATADVEAALKLAEADPRANADKIAVFGYCMGGKLTLELAQTMGDRVVAGASIHPGSMVTDSPESPHRHLDNISAELYFGIADKDALATPEQMGQLEEALGEQEVVYELEWHPGALHGFMMSDRPEMYHEKAAETVWQRIESLFARSFR